MVEVNTVCDGLLVTSGAWPRSWPCRSEGVILSTAAAGSNQSLLRAQLRYRSLTPAPTVLLRSSRSSTGLQPRWLRCLRAQAMLRRDGDDRASVPLRAGLLSAASDPGPDGSRSGAEDRARASREMRTPPGAQGQSRAQSMRRGPQAEVHALVSAPRMSAAGGGSGGKSDKVDGVVRRVLKWQSRARRQSAKRLAT